MKLVVATAIFGGYDKLHRPLYKPRIPHICFTDGSVEHVDPWELRHVHPDVEDRRLRAYHCKILTHRHLLDQADTVLWIDGNFQLLMDPEEFAAEYLTERDIATFEHFARDCVYEEAEACIRYGRLTPSADAIRRQVAAYRAEGYPAHMGMIEGCVLLRRYLPWVVDFCELWWDEAVKHSSRMQLSFNYLMWKLGRSYTAIPVEIYRKVMKQHRHLRGDP